VTAAVNLTAAAERDLNDIFDWIAFNDPAQRALKVLPGIQDVIDFLQEFPERGVITPELQVLGIKQYRQVFYKPYRLIYSVIDQQVLVFLVADGRRDMRTLLSQRLLRS